MDRRNLIETEIIKTKGMIAKLEQLGINVLEYNNQLELIIKKKSNIKTNNNNTIFTTIELEHQQLLNELDALQETLSNENDYFSALSLVELIELSLDNQEKIDKYINYITKVLSLIRNWNSSFKMNKDAFIQRFYGVIFQIIKLELIKNNDSKLLEIILSNEIDIIYLDSVIQNEIKEDESLANDRIIKEKTLSLDLQGLDNHYVDKELIKLIATSKDTDFTFANIQNQLTEYIEEVRENNEKVLTLKEQIDSQEANLEEAKSTVKEFKRNIVKRVSSLAVTLTLITGVNLGHYKLAKDVIPKAKYKTSIETYDSSLDTYQITSDYLIKEENNGHVSVKVYDTPLEKNFMSSSYDGDYTHYYLASDILKDISLKDLITMYLEDKEKFYEFIVNHNGSVENKTSTIRKESEVSNYRNGTSIVFKLDKITLNLEKNGYYIEAEKYYQDDLEDYRKNFDYAYFLPIGFILWAFMLGAEIIRWAGEKNGIVNDFENLFRKNGDIDNYRFYKSEEKELLKAKTELLKELAKILLSNKDLVNKFISIYEQNQHSLTAYPEMQSMYEEIVSTSKTLKLNKYQTYK